MSNTDETIERAISASDGDVARMLVSTMPEPEIFPLEGLALCEFIGGDERTAGGIVVPKQVQEKRMPRWRVLRVGHGRIGPKGDRIPMGVTEGDVVLVCPPRGEVIELPAVEGRQRALVSEAAIIAIVRTALQ
jgi:co-chaperonin GroES (HSP10)